MSWYKKIIITLLLMALWGQSPVLAADGGSVTFSVSPPLFKVSMKPGDSWSSFVKVINNNAYEMTVYAQVSNFKSGETGGVEFIKNDAVSDYANHTLGGWVSISNQPIIVPAFSSQDVPFAIKLPIDADPGGHYAAILLGNKPLEQANGNVIKFSSKLASLILVKVEGEIKEVGEVVEFSSEKWLNNNLSTNLKLRFKNNGNVHIHPEGQIKITNFFGEERGNIEVNRSQNFGNVLPESEKQWEFNWHGTNGLLDAGPMRAELILSYGDKEKKSVSRHISFWTINLRPTLTVFGTLVALVALIAWLIRRYVRKSMEAMRREVEARSGKTVKSRSRAAGVRLKTRQESEIKGGLLKSNLFLSFMNWSSFKKSFMVALLLITMTAGIALAVYYNKYGFFDDNLEPAEQTDKIEQPIAAEKAPASESQPVDDAIQSQAASQTAVASSSVASSTPIGIEVDISNGSGIAGLGAEIGTLLAKEGFLIGQVGTEAHYKDLAVMIKFSADQLDKAKAIDVLLNNQAEMSLEKDGQSKLKVILGAKYKR